MKVELSRVILQEPRLLHISMAQGSTVVAVGTPVARRPRTDSDVDGNPSGSYRD